MRTPLRKKTPNSVSVCGKVLRKGQVITVPESAIGPREKKQAARGKIVIRKSNKPDCVQVRCMLK